MTPCLQALTQPLIRTLTTQAAMGAVVVIELLPLLQALIELLDVGDDHPLELPVELFVVDPMGSLALPVEMGRRVRM